MQLLIHKNSNFFYFFFFLTSPTSARCAQPTFLSPAPPQIYRGAGESGGWRCTVCRRGGCPPLSYHMSSRYCCPCAYRRRRRYYSRKSRNGLYAPKNPYNLKQEPSPVHVNDYNFTPDDAPQLREILDRGGFLADLDSDPGPEYETKYITINTPGEKHYDDANYFHGKVTNDLYVLPYIPGYFMFCNNSNNPFTRTHNDQLTPLNVTIPVGEHYQIYFHYGSVTDHGVSQATVTRFTATTEITINVSPGDTLIDFKPYTSTVDLWWNLTSEYPLDNTTDPPRSPFNLFYNGATIPQPSTTQYPVYSNTAPKTLLFSFPGPLYFVYQGVYPGPIMEQGWLCYDPSIPRPTIP